MKKKIYAFLATGVILASLASCGKTNSTSNSDNTDTKTDGLVKVEGKTYYCSPTGISSNDGSEGSPLDFVTAVNKLQKGDTLIALDGNYEISERQNLSVNGDAVNYINVTAKNPGNVTLDFSAMDTADANRGIQLIGDYWHFYGIDVKGAGDNGMYIAGSYNIIEYCTFHENRDTGLQLGRGYSTDVSIDSWPHNNLIKNCTSYDNCDVHTYGENADGFAAKLTVGEGNVFDGCIAYRNADDGWDLYAKSDTGNVGTTVIKNCLAFENGWLLTKRTDPDGNESYATRDGDGIGFKLGGSNMEGSVVVENCMAFNNRLHGFSDNSNPGVLSLKNCTAYNNSVYMSIKDENGEYDETGNTGVFGANDGQSDNFNLARTSASYNNYYGLLSYTTNKTIQGKTYTNNDEYVGSMGYSILQSGKNKYISFTSYMDASSYDSNKSGKDFNGMSDSVFESVDFGSLYEVNEHIHTTLRNSDGSLNVGKMLNVVDENLLKFANGKQVGASLNKTSWDLYDHYGLGDYTSSTDNEDLITAKEACDVLEIMCNKDAVYQDVKLLTTINGHHVAWESSNEKAFVVSDSLTTVTSQSGLTYVWGKVHRSATEDITVTLTATISVNDESASKEFTLVLKKNDPGLGKILGVENKYMLEENEDFELPTPTVTDVQSYSDLPLTEGSDYEVETEILYSESSSSKYSYKVSQVYSSVPGVYNVTYKVISKLSNGEKSISKSFNVYVISPKAELDFTTNNDVLSSYGVTEGCNVNVSRDGVTLFGVLNNIYGNLYIATSSDKDTMTKEEVIANGTKFDVTDETITAVAKNENVSAYHVFAVLTSKDGTKVSDVITKEIKIENIETTEELYNLFAGVTSSDSTTIYSLQNDLDFENYTWNESTSTSTFSGLFNGNGHKISNINFSSDTDKRANLIYKIKGGTLMNVEFENISISGNLDKVTRAGIVGQMAGGYIHNVVMKNISVQSYQSAAALLGQACGGVNYITNCVLTNDETASIGVKGKYAAGLVANVQKDTEEVKCEIYISDSMVNATIGTNKDSGGYAGGIIGRIKGEYDCYQINVTNCYVTGVIVTAKNYAGGIIGGNESGSGHISVLSNVSNVVIKYAGTDIGYGLAAVVKNGSPIYGRYTAGLGTFVGRGNQGPVEDYNKVVNSDSEGFYDNIITEEFWIYMAHFDMENTWQFVKDADGNLTGTYVELRK